MEIAWPNSCRLATPAPRLASRVPYRLPAGPGRHQRSRGLFPPPPSKAAPDLSQMGRDRPSNHLPAAAVGIQSSSKTQRTRSSEGPPVNTVATFGARPLSEGTS